MGQGTNFPMSRCSKTFSYSSNYMQEHFLEKRMLCSKIFGSQVVRLLIIADPVHRFLVKSRNRRSEGDSTLLSVSSYYTILLLSDSLPFIQLQ